MLSIALQIVECVSFVALLVLIWRVSKRPRWRIRAVVYGWAAFFLLSVFWCFLMPAFFRGMDLHLPIETFPDGTIAMAALVGGWFWPLIIVLISGYRDRKKTGDDHVV
jgi:membrane associated rhomboid family serine protease